MEVRLFVCLLLLSLTFDHTNGFGVYRNKIPNGNKVSHPCRPNYLWQGVGHRTKEGGGYRNPFGIDFAASGHKWTTELCQKDSDGDGMTNGQELGDPQCTWSEGKSLPEADKVTHPGVCEPWTDPKCQKQLEWLAKECEPDVFECDAVKNDPDVKNMTLQFPLTDVPVEDTTYICMEFELDTSDDYHLIATQPILDNVNVMHHAVLFGCTSTNHTLRSTPHMCGMSASRECGEILNVWTLGLSGSCLHEKIGFRIGSKGFTRVALQFHWNNPTLESGQKDQSGMILHYTTNRRTNDAGVYLVGSEYLEIPGKTNYHEETAICPGICTSQIITDKTYVVSALNHMHYLGMRQQIEQFRNGTKIRDITNDMNYNYDDPRPIRFDTPIELLPGDTLTTKCVYNSESRDYVTYFGDATSAEMCYGFLTYYPRENIQQKMCTSWKSLPTCALWAGQEWEGCNYLQAYQQGYQESLVVVEACSSGCTPGCKESIELYLSDVCLQGDFYDYSKYLSSFSPDSRDFFTMMENCNPRTTTTTSVTTEGGTNGNDALKPIIITVSLLLCVPLWLSF